MIQINIEMPKGCNACPFSLHYNSGGAHGFYCSLSNIQEHRWGEANDDGFKFADCPISAVEYKMPVLDTIRDMIMQLDYNIDSVDYDYDDMSYTEEVHMICREEVLQIIDEFKAESEVSE